VPQGAAGSECCSSSAWGLGRNKCDAWHVRGGTVCTMKQLWAVAGPSHVLSQFKRGAVASFRAATPYGYPEGSWVVVFLRYLCAVCWSKPFQMGLNVQPVDHVSTCGPLFMQPANCGFWRHPQTTSTPLLTVACRGLHASLADACREVSTLLGRFQAVCRWAAARLWIRRAPPGARVLRWP